MKILNDSEEKVILGRRGLKNKVREMRVAYPQQKTSLYIDSTLRDLAKNTFLQYLTLITLGKSCKRYFEKPKSVSKKVA